ncbi:Dimethyladenosine transferase [Salix suchowensis]|nr:Dimethyladenosine transferase [Salix suchowensis]
MAANMSGTASYNSSLYYDYYSDDYSMSIFSTIRSLRSFDLNRYGSTNSTPNKQGAAGVRHRTRDNMDAALQEDLLGRTLRDVSIEDFQRHEVHNVKSVDSKFQGLAEYNTALSKGLPENALYVPFKTIMDDLFGKFRDDGYKLDIKLASLGHEQLKSTGTPRKPDGLFMFKSHQDSDKVSWSLSKAFLEFQISPSDQRIRKEARGARGRMRTIREGRTPVRSAPDSRVNVGAIASAPDLAPSPILKTPSGFKRRSSDVLEIEEQGHSKRPKQMTRKEAQGAGYALEMMAAACRRWATGFVIRDKTVWVHYYDRIGAIFTKEFNLSEEPQKLAMVALALAKCDVIQAGFEPLISSSLDSPLSAPLAAMDGAFLRLPVCDDDAGASM